MAAPEPSPVLIELRNAAVSPESGSGSPKIEDVNWKVHAGDYWVIGGLHWSGKTAFLSTISGLLRPMAGEHFLFGKRLEELDEADMVAERLRVGIVFDNGGRLFSHLTVADNIALPMCYHRNCDLEEAAERTEQVLECTELVDLAHRTPGQLSRNLQQRAGLARALAMAPEVLLLDNPLTGLAPLERYWWLEFLGQLSNGHKVTFGKKMTIVVMTDDLAAWKNQGKQFAMFKDKRMVPIEKREDIRADPFVSEMLSQRETQ